jgi:hypothetical protein
MKKKTFKKKTWEKPVIHPLDIKKVTFGGVGHGAEKNGKLGPPPPPS